MTDRSSARWQHIERLYHQALEYDTERRAAFLDETCRGDEELKREVESLLGFERAAGGFLERPALADAAHEIARDARPRLTGRRLGGYDVAAPLGVGGMGEVYRARDVRLGREIALKVLEPSIAADPVYLKRFEEEARSASGLNHPNIVTIYGVGEDDDIAFIAMELVQGRTLRECMTAEPLSIKDAIDIAAQIAGALTAAHASGIVHRDLKPENVMVTPEGLVKVLDFGIAKREGQVAVPAPTDRTNAQVTATQAGAILGTVGYMSPEQAAGKPATFASDQFSLGAILYEMLSGRRAFQSDSKVDTLAAIIGSQPPPVETLNPRVTAAVRRVLERCMAKAPEARYPTLRDLESELLRIRGTLMPGISRRRPLWFGAATAAAAVTAISIWWSWPLPTLAVLRPVRYFRYMSIFSPQATLVGLEFQAIGVLVIAILCAGLMQTTRRDPLFYWSVGWALLSASLVAMLASGYSLAFARVGVPLSLLCEYIFGYMVFAGCRLYASGRRVGLADAWLALTAVICAGALPWWFDWDFDRFYAIHVVICASLFIAAFVAIQRARTQIRGRAGLRAVQVALVLLSIRYLHTAPLFWFTPLRPPILLSSPFIDLLLQFLLMFGMMMIVTGGVQEELELAKAELATARDRLEALAQHDRLTSALDRHAPASGSRP